MKENGQFLPRFTLNQRDKLALGLSIPLDVALRHGEAGMPGERSDPDYQPTTVLLRKQTKKTASRLLEDADTRQDLSELIEQLLAEWIRQQT